MQFRNRAVWYAVVAGMLLVGRGATVQATTCDLTSGTDSSCTIVGDSSVGTVIFGNPDTSTIVGSGLIDPFLTVQQNGTESGFSTDLSDNNNLPLDDKRDNLSKFTNTFTLGDVSIV